MVASASNKQAKAADGASFPLALLDQSGTGVGPYQPIHASADSTGALIDPATAGKQDMANVALGAPADAAWVSGNGSVIALLKGIFGKLGAVVLAAGTAVIGKVGLQVGGNDLAITNPLPIQRSQATVSHTTVTAVAATAASLMAADAARRGARIVNYLPSPIYIVKGSTGTPSSGAPSDMVPAMISGIPGQFEFGLAPVDDYRYVCASAGTFTLITY